MNLRIPLENVTDSITGFHSVQFSECERMRSLKSKAQGVSEIVRSGTCATIGAPVGMLWGSLFLLEGFQRFAPDREQAFAFCIGPSAQLITSSFVCRWTGACFTADTKF